MRSTGWLAAYLAPLKGRTVKEVGVSDDGSHIVVSQDAEGNSPGFLLGLPRPTASSTKR